MFKYLLEKEFKQIRRNHFLPKMILGFPIMALLVFPWAASFEIKNIALTAVDHDHSAMSARLVEKAVSSGYFIYTQESPDMNAAMEAIEHHKADIILEIPNGFERAVTRGEPSTAGVSANAVDATKGGLGSSYLASIVADFSADLNGENGTAQAPKLSVESRFLFNPHSSYKMFMVPALMVMLLTMLSGFLPAVNIVGEKESGSIEQMNVTPVHRFTFILAKLLPYWLIGLVVLSIGMIIARLVYGLIPIGSIGTIYLFAVVYVIAIAGFGLTISNGSDTMQQAMFVMFFFISVFILLSGLFTPISSMPDWAKMITQFNPLRYFIEMMRGVYLRGAELNDLLPQLKSLLIFASVFWTTAVVSYRKSS